MKTPLRTIVLALGPCIVVAVGLCAGFVGGAAARVGGARDTTTTCGWTTVPTPSIPGAFLLAISAPAQKDVWVVGSRGALDHERTLILHFDGETFRIVPSPSPYLTSDLRDVVAFAPNDVWAVGTGVTMREPHYRYTPTVLHYDGARWRQVAVPSVRTGFGLEVHAIAGTGPDDIWLVGTANVRDSAGWVGLIEHYDGRQWRIVPTPPSEFFTLTAIAPGDVWAAGSSAPTYRPNRPVAHWNGRRWRLVKDAAQDGWATTARDSSASGASNIWIVGDQAAGPFVERFDGRRFTRVPVPAGDFMANYNNQQDSYLTGVEAVSPRDVWAVGNFGIEHYDGHRWLRSSPDDSLEAITAVTSTDIWATGGASVRHLTCP